MRDLKADLETCQRATPGPWIFDVTQIWHNGAGMDDPDDPHVCIATMDQEHQWWQEDGRFIAEAREGWPEAIRRAMAAEQGMEELHARLVADELEALDFLWQEYVQADPATLTEDAKELAERVRQKVRELAEAGKLEERVEDLKSAIARVIDRLQQHDHEDVYGPHDFVGTQCIVHDGVLCDVLDDLQAVLDKAGEG